MAKKNGGPAFPCDVPSHYTMIDGIATPSGMQPQYGMTLRDYFAAKAPNPPAEWVKTQRQLDRQRNPHNDSHKPLIRDYVEIDAAWRFKWADAMLKERDND